MHTNSFSYYQSQFLFKNLLLQDLWNLYQVSSYILFLWPAYVEISRVRKSIPAQSLFTEKNLDFTALAIII